MSTSSVFLIVVLMFLPGAVAFDWNDFTNNLATDLVSISSQKWKALLWYAKSLLKAPLITLFGEQVTKQFLSESLSIWDNVIFAMAPLGILTAVVSAIRVRGSPSLRAFIGRAQEGPGNVEVELLSSTSETTSELWNEGGIARVFGRPQILEVVKLKAGNNDYDGRDDSGVQNYTAGIHLFTNACNERHEDDSEIWKRTSAPETGNDENTQYYSPNLSLNVGIKRLPRRYTYGAAALGLTLQTGKSMSKSSCNRVD